ncbi:hydroxymethylpyrimidine pyrophosphatase-like HAD family hydrolase [Cytobacillus kochii]|nr:hydroxymethylpyrimidine pyrophosphatase-like HAD family hydrolase [Cytobacillus kochii]
MYPHEAIAFGDGDYDIDMVKLIGLGIAMGNGSQGVKAAADYVTCRASEGGISEALKKFNIL